MNAAWPQQQPEPVSDPLRHHSARRAAAGTPGSGFDNHFGRLAVSLWRSRFVRLASRAGVNMLVRASGSAWTDPAVHRACCRTTRTTAAILACLVMAGTAACGARLTTAAARAGVRSTTGWLPAKAALPSGAGAMSAPNFVWLPFDPGQPLLVYELPSLRNPASAAASVSPPAGYRFTQVTGADDDKTFAVLASPDADRGPDKLYELQLGSGGSPAPLIRLRLALPAESSDPALSADGTALAVTGSIGERQFIAVVSTSSGRARTWAWRGPRPRDLAWVGDAAIDFVTVTPRGRIDLTSSLYQLSIGQPGTLSRDARLLRKTFIPFGGLTRRSPWWVSQLVTTADGRTAFAALYSGSGDATRQVLIRMDAATGRPLAGLPAEAAGWNHDGIYCGVLWADSSGRHLVISCGSRSGRIDNGRFTAEPLPIAPYIPNVGSQFAWGG